MGLVLLMCESQKTETILEKQNLTKRRNCLWQIAARLNTRMMKENDSLNPLEIAIAKWTGQ